MFTIDKLDGRRSQATLFCSSIYVLDRRLLFVFCYFCIPNLNFRQFLPKRPKTLFYSRHALSRNFKVQVLYCTWWEPLIWLNCFFSSALTQRLLWEKWTGARGRSQFNFFKRSQHAGAYTFGFFILLFFYSSSMLLQIYSS